MFDFANTDSGVKIPFVIELLRFYVHKVLFPCLNSFKRFPIRNRNAKTLSNGWG